jgi:Flp pilus assembly protein TadG
MTMIAAQSLALLFSRLRDFRRDRHGVAAIEFAIILPFMLLLYIGGVELGDGYAINVKVTDTAHIVADLASQNTSINNAGMLTILGASAKIIAPYDSSVLTVTLSEVSTDSSGKATVTWSDSYQGTPRTVGQAMTLPTSLAGQANISLILGEVTYAYTPNLGYAISGTVTLLDSYYLFPRNSISITRVNS